MRRGKHEIHRIVSVCANETARPPHVQSSSMAEPPQPLGIEFSSAPSHDRRANDRRLQMQKEVEDSKQKILQQIQDREKDLDVLQEEHENISRSADSALVDIQNTFTHLFSLMEKQLNQITQQIKAQQESEQRRVMDLREKLQQEIIGLKVKYYDLDHLSDSCSSLQIKIPASSLHIFPCALRYFAAFSSTIASLSSKLQQTLSKDCLKITQTVPEVLLSRPQPLPKIRSEFLQYSRELTLDYNTAHTMLLLSDGNRKVMFAGEHQVELSGAGVYVALAYASIKRQGNSYECLFGSNEKSWALCCTKQNNSFMNNGVKSKVKCKLSHRIGVYLDYAAGILFFYSVFSDQIILLHKVVRRFTEPLHSGLRLWANESAVSFTL